MRACEITATIKAPASAVWSRLAAVCEWPSWLPTVSSVIPAGDQQLAIGRQYQIVQPRLRPATWTVTEFTPGRSFTWESRSPGVMVMAQHIVTNIGADTSTVLLRITFAGLLAPVAFLLGRRLTNEYIGREAEAIRTVVERSHGAA